MSDEKPDLTQTELRQGNRRRTNLRALIAGLVLIVIGFAIALWFSTLFQDDTETGVDPGATLQEETADPEGEGENLEDTPLPAPEEENLVEQ